MPRLFSHKQSDLVLHYGYSYNETDKLLTLSILTYNEDKIMLEKTLGDYLKNAAQFFETSCEEINENDHCYLIFNLQHQLNADDFKNILNNQQINPKSKYLTPTQFNFMIEKVVQPISPHLPY